MIDVDEIEQDGRGDHWQRNAEELTRRAGTVDGGGLVQVNGNVLDIRVEDQHHRTDAERAGEDDRDDSPLRVDQHCGPSMPSRDSR